MRSQALSYALLFCATLVLPGCTLDGFLFNARPLDEDFRFDEIDPKLEGEISEPHPSLVPAAQRMEGFVDAEGNAIHWVYAQREDALGTILYSHGTTWHLGRYWDRVELLWELGFNVLIYDYPGYGLSEGSPSEEGVMASARAARGLLETLPGVETENVIYFGYSLGGGPSYELAAESDTTISPRALISEASFCSVEALVQDGSFLDLPAGAFANSRFDNCARIAELNIPVMILHGLADDFIVPRHAEMLIEASNGAESLFIEGADHSELPVVDRDGYERAILNFLRGEAP